MRRWCWATLAIRVLASVRRISTKPSRGTRRCALGCARHSRKSSRSRQGETRASQGERTRESRALLSCREVPLQTSEDTLSRFGQEQRSAASAVWICESGAGAQVSGQPTHPSCVLKLPRAARTAQIPAIWPFAANQKSCLSPELDPVGAKTNLCVGRRILQHFSRAPAQISSEGEA